MSVSWFFFLELGKLEMVFTTLTVSCVLEIIEVNSVKKKHALVLCESPKVYFRIMHV